jgi:hypothetical protein
LRGRRADERTESVGRVLREITVLVSVAAALCFALHSARAWLFPWPIDYGEGPLLDQAQRIASGESLYPAAFGKYHGLVSNYPPAYPCLFALAGKLFGLSFSTGRAITGVAVLGSAGFVGALVHRMTERPLPALLAIALFLSSPAVFFWSMFARVDFLALAFALASLWVLVSRPRAASTPYVTAILSVLAVFTRQSYLLAGALPVVVVLWRASRRRAIGFALLVTLATSSLVVGLQGITQGEFLRHVVAANVQAYHFRNVLDAAKRLLLSSAPLAMASLWVLFSTPATARAGRARLDGAVLGPFLVGALLSAFTIGKVGSAANHLIPLVAALAIWGGVAFGRAAEVTPPSRARGRLRFGAHVAALLVLQVPWMVYFGLDLSESTDDKLRRAAEFAQLAEVIRAETTPVIADEAAGLVALGGHRLVVDPFDLTQLVQAGVGRQERLVSDLRAKRFGLLLVGEPPLVPDACTRERWTPEMLEAIHDSYEPRGVLGQATMYRPRH